MTEWSWLWLMAIVAASRGRSVVGLLQVLRCHCAAIAYGRSCSKVDPSGWGPIPWSCALHATLHDQSFQQVSFSTDVSKELQYWQLHNRR